MKLSRSAIAFYFALVFASGAILGVFGQRLYTATTVNANATKNPQEFRKRVIAEMRDAKAPYENLYRHAGAEVTIMVGFRTEALKPLTGRTLADYLGRETTAAARSRCDAG